MNIPVRVGERDDRGVPYHAESTLSSAQVLKLGVPYHAESTLSSAQVLKSTYSYTEREREMKMISARNLPMGTWCWQSSSDSRRRESLDS